MIDKTKIMRRYVNETLPGCESVISTLTEDDLEKCIDNYYQGGLNQFRLEFLLPKHTIDPASEVALKCRIRDMHLKDMRIQACDTVLWINESNEKIMICVETHIIQEQFSRTILKKKILRVHTFVNQIRTDVLEIKDASFDPEVVVGQYGRITTPERYESMTWQYAECYRPGTPKSPLDGPESGTRQQDHYFTQSVSTKRKRQKA